MTTPSGSSPRARTLEDDSLINSLGQGQLDPVPGSLTHDKGLLGLRQIFRGADPVLRTWLFPLKYQGAVVTLRRVRANVSSAAG